MSRIAKAPVVLPSGVEVTIDGQAISVKGAKGMLHYDLPKVVQVQRQDETLMFSANDDQQSSTALAGTSRAVVNNMVIGVSAGFVRKLELVGVGYRAQAQGKNLNLSVGYSNPVSFAVPEGIAVETPSQTEVVIQGTDKQLVGQIAAKIRAVRPPEPYKGKGIRYAGETISLKEAKKK